MLGQYFSRLILILALLAKTSLNSLTAKPEVSFFLVSQTLVLTSGLKLITENYYYYY